MKKILLLALLSIPLTCMAEKQSVTELKAHNIFDTRTTLDLSTAMQHRLLSDMRKQLSATQAIVGLLAEEKFDKAAKTARTKLGISEDLKKIYSLSKNEDFNKLGEEAHASAEELANMLSTKDLKKSLQALRKTMGYCVQCHNKYRQ